MGILGTKQRADFGYVVLGDGVLEFCEKNFGYQFFRLFVTSCANLRGLNILNRLIYLFLFKIIHNRISSDQEHIFRKKTISPVQSVVCHLCSSSDSLGNQVEGLVSEQSSYSIVSKTQFLLGKIFHLKK